MRSDTTQRVLTLDFGAHTIKLGEFKRNHKNGLTLLNYGVRVLEHYDQKERISSMVSTLKDLLEETRIKPGPVVVGVSETFMRFVRLPAVLEEHSVAKIMEFEAKQNIPSPLDEVIWDYKLLSDGEEKEALLVAIKKDFLEEVQAALAHLRMEIARVEITPWAVMKAYRFNYPDSHGCSLLADIGDKTTHLVFVEGEKIFCRSLPIAGHLISKNIAKEFQRPLNEAEEVKRKLATLAKVGNGAVTEAELVSKIVRSVFSQLHVELSQAIHIYQEHQGGLAPEIVFLTGGTSLIKDAAHFLKKKLSLPVEHLNPFKRVSIASLLNQSRASKDLAFLAPLVGMALEEDKEFDLRPPSIRKKTEEKTRRPWWMAALIVWLAVFLVPLTMHVRMLKNINAELAQRQTLLQKTGSLWKQIQTKEELFLHDLEMLQLCENFAKQRSFWPELFNELNSCIPDDVWLTSLKLEKGVLTVKGFVEAGPHALDEISLFKKALIDGGFFDDVQSTQEELNPQDSGNALAPLGFELQGLLKTEKAASL